MSRHSIGQLVTTSGTVASLFTYDPYGNRTTVSGIVIPDVGYAGYFYHAMSGLNFALNRAYDSTHGRWINRDPSGEAGGINLYAYVGGNPLSNIDSLGLCPNPLQLDVGPDPYPALNDPNFFKFQESLSPPDVAIESAGQDPLNAASLFYYGSLTGVTVGATGGLTYGLTVVGTEMAEFIEAGGSPLVAPLVGADAIANLSLLGAMTGTAIGSAFGLAIYGA